MPTRMANTAKTEPASSKFDWKLKRYWQCPLAPSLSKEAPSHPMPSASDIESEGVGRRLLTARHIVCSVGMRRNTRSLACFQINMFAPKGSSRLHGAPVIPEARIWLIRRLFLLEAS
eukprot:TRINITY_DN50429_c0_g1_i1.p1 TRINITY_DN50429_c0_g1~~TRINITY_DN50429_c0_g1_i1.p1  ORF type:complete len:117 (-),score=5.89 TRINITY_DN50429_c0_g1_i1:49-399(-)